MNPYAELAQDIWPKATPEQIAVLSNALRKAFVRSASPKAQNSGAVKHERTPQ